MKLSEKIRGTFGWKGLKSLEFRLTRLFLRALLMIGFLVYMGTNAAGAWTWLQVKWVQSQNLSQLERVAQRGIDEDDTEWAEKWISFRPLSESADVMRRAEPFSGHFSPFLFFNFARRAAALGDDEQKRFWIMYARYRLRYDVVRCGARDDIDSVTLLLEIAQDLDQKFFADPPRDEAIRLARRVLDFDARNPAVNDPQKLCRLLKRMSNDQLTYVPIPKEKWPQARFDLRFGTDLSLKRAEEDENRKKISTPPAQSTAPTKAR